MVIFNSYVKLPEGNCWKLPLFFNLVTTTSLEAWPTGRVRRSIRLPERVLDPEFVHKTTRRQWPLCAAAVAPQPIVLKMMATDEYWPCLPWNPGFHIWNWSDLICLYLFSHSHWKIMSFHSSSVLEVLRDGCSLPPSTIINPRSPSQDIPRRSPLGETAGLDWYLLKPTRPPAACRRPNPQIPNDSQVIPRWFPGDSQVIPRWFPGDSQVILRCHWVIGGFITFYHRLMTHWIMGKI